jgi:leader peptidase (prepilin peptidase)/N-methyltransferase
MFDALSFEPLASIAVTGLGLVLGSFLNVCIHRLPRGESVVSPGSRCPGCGHSIRWYENIPVLSWIALRGRCSSCKAGISVRYPFVELLSGGILLTFWKVFGPTWPFLIASLFALALVVLFFTDLDLQLLPDWITLSGFVAGVALAWFNPFLGEGNFKLLPAVVDEATRLGLYRIWMALAGAALGAGFLWGLGAAYSKLRGVEAMGMGDVKMMAMVGAFTGPIGVLFTIFSASFIGASVGVAMIPLRGRSLQDTLPFGCFLAPAALAALLVGRRAFHAYFELLSPTL